MKTKKFKIENDEFVQVYLNVGESNNPTNITEIEDIKNNSNVAIFVNCTNDAVKTIKEMLNYEKNSSKKIDL